MDEERKKGLHTDAGGNYAEEDAVCYLQILLSDQIEGYNRDQCMDDMDAWGYSFRLGSARAWFEEDAKVEQKPVTPKVRVAPGYVVSIDYTIADDEGIIQDSTEGRSQFSYIHGSERLLKGLQKELEGKSEGDVISARLLPKDGFGMHDPERTQSIELPLFLDVDELQEGMQFETDTDDGFRLVTVKH
ncbi:unnamed protein product, partial [Cyprideis torosa]